MDCMRLWYWPFIKHFSGDLLGIGLIVYMLSRAFAAKASAAAATLAEVFGFVTGLDEDAGFRGRGGGARSGSELSHLMFPINLVSFVWRHALYPVRLYRGGLRRERERNPYMGTEDRPESETEGWCLSTSSRSRDPSLSTDGIVKTCCSSCSRVTFS